MSGRVALGITFAASLAASVTASLTLVAVPAGAVASPSGAPAARTARACALPAPGHAACSALLRLAADGQLAAGTTPSGYGPSDLQSAYVLPSASAGSGQTVALVDAYNDPNAETDLAVYRSHYGLAPCTTANGCFRKVNQAGGTSYPRNDAGWGQEISLDLDMVSAICPKCSILLVEATSSSFVSLGTSVNRAVTLGAQAVSNSYGGSDVSDTRYGKYFNHPGHAITVSTGDDGYGVQYPASSRYVTAVGGTHLSRDGSARGWTESAWSGAGSGCSAANVKPSWQHDAGCAKRAVADVSAIGDPQTGVAVYDTFGTSGGGWFVFGGTSVSAPIIASVYALAGNAAHVTYGSFPYAHTGSLFDVTTGSNGSCTTGYLCHAGAGFDGPTGLGTPHGTGAF